MRKTNFSKKPLSVLSIVFAMIIGIVIQSCQIDSDNEMIDNELSDSELLDLQNNKSILYDSRIVQKKLATKAHPKNSMQIKAMSDKEQVTKIINKVGIPLIDLNIENAKKVKFGWLNIDLYEIPYSNDDARIFVYSDNENYIPIKVRLINNQTTGNIKVLFSDLTENISYVEFEMTENNEYKNYKSYNKIPLNKKRLKNILNLKNKASFAFNKTYLKNDISLKNLFTMQTANAETYDPMEDCGAYDFVECLECGMSVCDQDWRCRIASYATGPAFAAGLLITCGLEQIDN